MINDDIDEIIRRGEERTSELNQKYETLNLDDLSNFKSEASLQQWEGEDFRSVRILVYSAYGRERALTIAGDPVV